MFTAQHRAQVRQCEAMVGQRTDEPVSFEDAVDRVLRALGPGDLVTYGEVATEAGFPGRARAVGRLLASSEGRYPWWRVVTSTGRLVPGLETEHARRLAAEGHDTESGRVRERRAVNARRAPGR